MNDIFNWLVKKGCRPSIHYRGNVWRAHINSAGNFWADAEEPIDALNDAVKLWNDKGRPMDGMASINRITP